MTVSIAELDLTLPSCRQYIIDTCSGYTNKRRRQHENYTAENFQRMFTEDRFDLGFFVVGPIDSPLAMFGLSEHDGWVCIVRYIKLDDTVWHVAAEHVFPYVFANFKHMKGVFLCGNGKRNAPLSWQRRKIDRPTTKYWSHKQDLEKFKVLPYTVLHRGVEQHVMYAGFNTDDVPPLPPYKG